MQRLTKREAVVLCDLLLEAKRNVLAAQAQALTRGAGDEKYVEQLRVLDRAVSMMVTTRLTVADLGAPPATSSP
ncbi:MAG: hypothetical protein U1E50_19490 [Caulobacteraceae bacterium]